MMNIAYAAIAVLIMLNLYLWLRPDLLLKKRRKEKILKFNEDNGLARFDDKTQKWVCTKMPIGYCDDNGNVLFMDEALAKVVKETAFNKRITSEEIPVFIKKNW